jgi:hypothetical protein
MTDFTFTPEEYQVLEDIEFEEEIQRPEKIRFYTFEEQTADAYDRMLPQGKVTLFQKETLRYELDTMERLYKDYIITTATDYEIREREYGKNIPWVFPIVSTVKFPLFDFRSELRPVQNDRLSRNYYTRLITALPRFDIPANGGDFPLQKPMTFLSGKRDVFARLLPAFETTRTQYHEDKTFDVVRVPIEGSADTPRIRGYYLQQRPFPIPNPLAGHPFLEDNKAKHVPTDVPLKDAFPSMDAILNHAVPITKDPYGEGQQYLKLYDIKLSDITWSEWRNRFPPVEVLADVPIPEPITFPKVRQVSPPEKLIKAYRTEYAPGVSGRRWLMDQLDGGELMVRMLLSSSLNNGSVGEIPGVNLPALEYPKTTIAECNLLGLNFQDFTTKGILRRTEKMDYRCVPMEFIRQERARYGYMNRIPWREELSESLLRDYMMVLDQYFPIGSKPKEENYERTLVKEDSQLHLEVLAILRDEQRTTTDKIKDTRALLRDALYANFTYTDQEGRFVLCDHTLAQLNGDLERDRLLFYDTWTSREDGSRICKYCGQEVNTDVVDYGDDFDDAGLVVKRAEVLEENKPDESLETIAKFTEGLKEVKENVFLEDNPVDDTCYLLLSILHVLPKKDSITSILQLGRIVAEKTAGKPDNDKSRKFYGIVGIAVAILILQTDISLIPQRSFGPRPLKLSGFPRDTPTPGNFSIVDSMILVIQKTFRNFPTAFKGPSQQLIRGVLKNPKEIKTFLVKLLDLNSKASPFVVVDKEGSISKLLQKAREQRKQLPPEPEDPVSLIPVVAPPEPTKMNTVFRYECADSRPIWNSGRVPPVRQAVVDLRPGIRATTKAAFIKPAVSVRAEAKRIERRDIQNLVKKIKANKKSVLPITDNYRTNLLLASHVRNLFQLNIDIPPVDPNQNEAELRDYSKGILAAVLEIVEENPTMKTALENLRSKDIALYSLLADYTKEDQEVKRARAYERLSFVERMGKKTDMEREVDNDLLQIGLASYVITREDRRMYAKEAERIQDIMRATEEVDEGVGESREPQAEEDEAYEGQREEGDYGDHQALPNVDGRDVQQDYMGRDSEEGI